MSQPLSSLQPKTSTLNPFLCAADFLKNTLARINLQYTFHLNYKLVCSGPVSYIHFTAKIIAQVNIYVSFRDSSDYIDDKDHDDHTHIS